MQRCIKNKEAWHQNAKTFTASKLYHGKNDSSAHMLCCYSIRYCSLLHTLFRECRSYITYPRTEIYILCAVKRRRLLLYFCRLSWQRKGVKPRDHNCYESQGIGRQRYMPHVMFSLVTRGVLSSLEPLFLRLYLLASDKYLDISLTFPSIYISFFTSWELID